MKLSFIRLGFYLLMIAGLGISACSTGPNQPTFPADTTTKTIDRARSYFCQSGHSSESDIPLDCPDWNRRAWAGDTSLHNNYQAIQVWVQAVALSPDMEPDPTARIDVDFMVLIEADRHTHMEQTIAFLSYESFGPVQPTRNQGGLFSRWYKDNTFLDMSNAVIKDGCLSVWPARHTDRVSHWWMNDDGKYPRRNDCDYYVKCRVRSMGPVVFQFGADYYLTIYSNFPDNTEAWHSAWFGATWNGVVTDGEYGDGFVTICFPLKY
jgi:hypothetical protein